MLKVFAHVNGGQEQVEVRLPPAGQQLASLQAGRKVHFWWRQEELAGVDPDGHRVLSYLVPNMDLIIVGRETPVGWQVVFKGAVVESGFDGQTLSVTALEPSRPTPPQSPPAGGVREPVVPGGPTGPQRLVEGPPPPEVGQRLPEGFFRSDNPAQDLVGRRDPVGAAPQQ